VAAILGGRAPVIHTDGSPQRRHLHAADAADAYLAVADALGTDPAGGGAAGEAFNVGGDALHSVREVAEVALALGGVPVTPDYRGAPVAPDAVDRLDVDTAKLRSLTGWAPRIALRDGLERTLEWYRSHPEVLGA
jgi:CDP-glucose 4,6-dehydratase